jgi:hypothetical protein
MLTEVKYSMYEIENYKNNNKYEKNKIQNTKIYKFSY